MALPNLTGQYIQDTYQRLVQTDGSVFTDGTGSLVSLSIGSLWEVDAFGDIMPVAGSVTDQFWELDLSLDVMPRI
tara:strand:+ start:16 stop:240 length:225 start_codon:yes stop_codon:yes gene_type:complete